MLLKVLHSICQQIWKTQQWPQDWKTSIFIPILKKDNAKECSDYHMIALISLASKVMLKILQARLQQYVNWELSDAQAGFRKGRGTRDQIGNIHWIIEKAREFQENINFCLIDYAEVFDCVSSVQFSRSIVSDPVPHGLQLLRPPCPSPTPGACSNSCPSSRWCHPTIASLYSPLLLLFSIFPSIRVFSNESVLCIRWPKYWSFSNSLSNEY